VPWFEDDGRPYPFALLGGVMLAKRIGPRRFSNFIDAADRVAKEMERQIAVDKPAARAAGSRLRALPPSPPAPVSALTADSVGLARATPRTRVGTRVAVWLDHPNDRSLAGNVAHYYPAGSTGVIVSIPFPGGKKSYVKQFGIYVRMDADGKVTTASPELALVVLGAKPEQIRKNEMKLRRLLAARRSS
jgi:hypothetical protein